MYDLVIVGAGIVGFSSAIYAGRFHMKTLVIGENTGGTIILTNEVENYPGFDFITRQDLFDKVKAHAEKYNIESKETKVERLEKKDDHFLVETVDEKFEAKTLLIATGSEWRKLNVPGELQFTGNGVHYCALCDGYAYQDKTIAIIGGSDSAAKEALLLAESAKKVYIVYRKDQIRAEPVNVQRVEQQPKIELIHNTNVLEIKGDKTVNKIILDREYNGSKELELDGIFINIGHIPITNFVKDIGVEINDKKEILINRNSETNVKGVYAAGDVVDTKFKQAITGVAEGVNAVYSAYHFIGK